jgi:cytochrome c oxidase subunit 2
MNDAHTRRGHIRRAFIIWVAATAVTLVVFLVLAPQLSSWGVLPPIASDRTGEIDNVLFLFTLLSIPVFMLVVIFAGYGVFTFNSRGRSAQDGPVMRGDRRLQVTWVVVSVLLVSFLFGYGLYFLDQVDAAPSGNVLNVTVTGEQWLWNYSYPQYHDVSGTTLELPVGRPVRFTIHSIDVQHSFWIPSLGIKQDAVPGETTHISATPSVIGDYVVRCAELCGIYHAYMETPVHVVSAADFDAWIAQQQAEQQQSGSHFHEAPAVALVRIADKRPFGAYEG